MANQTVSTPSSELVFNNTYTANCSQQYINDIVAAEKACESLWTNAVTVNITFDEQAKGNNGFLASNSWASWVQVSYAQLNSALPASDSLPGTDPTGGHTWYLPEAYARMLGLSSSTPSVDDTVTLNSSYNWSFGQDVVDTIEHEISEGAMGRVGGLGDQNSVWSTMDLFRYSSPGVRDLTDGRDGKTTYFSSNGSTLSSLPFNNEYNSNGTKNNSGDTADFTQQDAFGTGSPGETNTLSQTDIAVMDALGWTSPPPAPVLVNDNPLSVTVGGSGAITADDLRFSDSGFTDAQLIYTVTSGPSHGTLLKAGQAVSQFTQADIDSGLVQYRENGDSATGDAFSFLVTDPTGGQTGNSFQIDIQSPPQSGVINLPPNASYTDTQPNQTIIGGGGTTSVSLQSTGSVFRGDAGSDSVTVTGSNNTVIGAGGHATVDAVAGSVLILGGSGPLVLDGGAGAATVRSGTGPITVAGGAGASPLIFHNSGPLFFSGGSGPATVVGGSGAETIFANGGGGHFWGGSGEMLFVGGSGASTAVGGSGASTLFGGSSGRDLLVAGTGPSTLVGVGSGNQLVGIGTNPDVLISGGGNETLVGSADGGSDVMYANNGDDALFGGSGNDILVAASGNTQMIAGSGADLFVFSNGNAGGSAVIWNFAKQQDHVGLYGYGPHVVRSILKSAVVASGSTAVTLRDNTRITFADVRHLSAHNFVS